MSVSALVGRWMIVVAAVLLVLLVHVWLRTESVRLGYSISAYEKNKESLIQGNRQLRMRLSALRSVERLEARAREEFGLTDPVRARTVFESGTTQRAGRSSTNGAGRRAG